MFEGQVGPPSRIFLKRVLLRVPLSCFGDARTRSSRAFFLLEIVFP
jgi:hypothetical protein